MKAIVAYESLWGNTEQVARSIAAGLTERLEVTVMEVTRAPEAIPDDVALMVIGGPTQAFSLSSPRTRHEAFNQGATQGDEAIGIREWIGHLNRAADASPIATFDTRSETARRLPGSAAKKAAERRAPITTARAHPPAEVHDGPISGTNNVASPLPAAGPATR